MQNGAGHTLPSLSVDPDAPPRSRTPIVTTPKSAIIAIPPEWGASPGSSHRHSRHTLADAIPMSATSSSSSANPIFSWPPVQTSGGQSTTRDRPDSFMSASTSSSEHFNHSSSSSSDDEVTPHQPLYHVPVEQRRGSVVFLPHHLRSITDPLTGAPVDAEWTAAHGQAEEYDFSPEVLPPKFTRTFSAPLPNRVGFLRHPISPSPGSPLGNSQLPPRPLPSHSGSDSTSSSTAAELSTPLSTFSLELADSLQSAIQTLLHLSPPHLLDNAKEQYSGCTVQMPTTSLSALLTSMRSLNYLSANVQGLCEALGGKRDDGLLSSHRQTEDFDIGELVQNVADLLGGQAAQSGVDLVLFHGDVGIKHVSVNGDVEGLGYLLGHILRQILLVANKGDILEIGLQLIPQSPSLTPKVSLPFTATTANKSRKEGEQVLGETLSPQVSTTAEGPMLCSFEIIHNIYQSPGSTTATPRAEINPFSQLAEAQEAATPKLDTILCRRLLDQQHASLRKDVQPSSPLGSGMPRRAYELSVLLPRGKPLAEPATLSAEEEAIRQPFAGVKLGREPTLTELSQFAESLRGKKVYLHAGLNSLFARHLTSYLGAWGLDISHLPTEDEESPQGVASHAASTGTSPVKELASSLSSLSLGPKDTDRFIIIDDNVAILRRELLKLCNDSMSLKPRLLKRPTMGSRARSTPLIRPPTPTKPKAPVLIHFTSLANYNQVRDVIASVFGPQWSSKDSAFFHPEVMVIPKPVGPRRFLTALHTAVNQPLVDPTFSPIATTPRTPGGGYFWTNGRTPLGNELPREGFFDTVMEEAAELHPATSSLHTKSPMYENPPTSLQEHRRTGSDVVSTPATEYFSGASRSGNGASGMIIQSPDGRFGIHFEPPNKGERRSSYSQRTPGESLIRKPTSRRASGVMPEPVSSTASPTASPQSTRRQSTLSTGTDHSGGVSRKNSVREGGQERRRKTLPGAAEPLVVQGRQRSSTITQRKQPGSPSTAGPSAPSPSTAPAKKKAKEEVVVPPINVLIVEDNPINQNILSMFLRKKKIKHQSAKDGQEAIEKWRTGGFHLILMDIQLPVMDGITATRNIRAEEKKNNIGVYPSTPLGEISRQLDSIPASPLRSSVIIVALTASSLHSDRVAALGAGCNDFLTKPVSLKWLEKKIVEWGCMQALIDFEGWKRWKGVGPDSGETKRGFSVGPQQAARGVAERLRIERKTARSPARQSSTASLDINVHAPTPPLQPADLTPTPTPAESLDAARRDLDDRTETMIKTTHPDVTTDVASTPTPLEEIAEST